MSGWHRRIELQDRQAGIVIAAGTGLAVVSLALHPVVQAPSAEAALGRIVELARLDQLVHGVLMAIYAGLLFGFARFARTLGLGRPSVQAGLIAYGLGCLGVFGAALLDGFVIPDLARQYLGSAREAACGDLLVLCAILIQVLTRLALVAQSVGIAFWALAASLEPTRHRGIAVIGFGVAAALLVLVLAAPVMAPHGLIGILLLQGLWNLWIAAHLIRGAGQSV